MAVMVHDTQMYTYVHLLLHQSVDHQEILLCQKYFKLQTGTLGKTSGTFIWHRFDVEV